MTEEQFSSNKQAELTDIGFSIRDTIAIIKEYGLEIIRKIWIVIPLAVLLAGYMYRSKSGEVPIYTANLSFVLNQNEMGAGSPLAQFMPSTNTSLERMMEMMKTRKTMQEALFGRAKMGDSEDFLINHFIKEYGYGTYQFTDGDVTKFDRSQNGLLNDIISTIKTKMLVYNISPGEIVTLTFQSKKEQFALVFLKRLYEMLKQNYVNSVIIRQREAYDKLKHRVDSLSGRLNSTETAYAKDLDGNLLGVRKADGVRQTRLSREANLSSEAYYEAVKSMELASTALETSVPSIVIVDEPVLPLPVVVPSKRNALIMGALIGALLGVGIIIVRKVFLNMLRKEDEARAAARAAQSSQY